MIVQYLYIILFFMAILLQIILFNNIVFIGYASIIVYTYFIIKLPSKTNHFLDIFSGFILGLSIDIFLNTPGVNALATTIIGAFRKNILKLFYRDDDSTYYVPSIAKEIVFIKYSLFIIFTHTTILFLAESFSFIRFDLLLIRIISSTILSFIVIIGIDGFMYKLFHR